MPTAPVHVSGRRDRPYEDAGSTPSPASSNTAAACSRASAAYWSERERELFVFRLPEHLERLRFGMKLMRYARSTPATYLADCVLRMLRANELRENVHIRLIAYLGGDDELAQTGPVGLIAGALPRGSPKGVSRGIHVRVG